MSEMESLPIPDVQTCEMLKRYGFPQVTLLYWYRDGSNTFYGTMNEIMLSLPDIDASQVIICAAPLFDEIYSLLPVEIRQSHAPGQEDYFYLELVDGDLLRYYDKDTKESLLAARCYNQEDELILAQKAADFYLQLKTEMYI